MPLTFLVAPDSFKGSLTASEASMIMTRAVRAVNPGAKIIQLPIADGGEGTVETLISTTLGYYLEAEVTNAYGGRDIVPWGILGGTRTAIFEIAACAGLVSTPIKKRDPKLTTTLGLGELILESFGEFCAEIFIGLGDSATNDGGAGMAQALGIKLLDKNGKEVPRGGAALIDLHAIDIGKIDQRVLTKKYVGICDVEIQLLGENGTTKMFARQKGASDSDLVVLEDAMQNYAEIIKRDLGKEVASLPGSGAAGGVGAGLAAFLGAELRSGIEFILDTVEFDAKCAQADFILTGEGKIDEQTKQGKALMGISRRAKKYSKPVIAFAGIVDESDIKLRKSLGLQSMHCITPDDATEEGAFTFASKNLEEKVKQVVQILHN